MTDTNTTPSNNEAGAKADTPRLLDEISRSNQAKIRTRRSGLRRFMVVVLLLVPVILAISFLVYQQSRTQALLSQLQNDNAALQETLATLPQAEAAPAAIRLPDDLANTAMLTNLRQDLEARINALARNEANLEQRLSALPQERANTDWMWAEAEYLLRLANQKLQLEGDGDSALLVLGAVDELLRDSGEISLLGVRDMLAGEMLALRNMNYVDTSGLYVRLNNLLPLIEQLSLRDTVVENYTTQLVQARDDAANSDAGFLDTGMALLRSIFVWQQWDVAPEALLPPPQEATLKQNLRLMLEQAQLALLMAEPQIYRDSLVKGAQWTASYFANDQGAGRTLSQEMEALAATPITVNRPDISGSLDLLRQISGSRQLSSPDSGR